MGILDDIINAIDSKQYEKALELCVENPSVAESIAKGSKISLGELLTSLAENAIYSGADPLRILSMLDRYREAQRKVADFAIDYALSRGRYELAIEIAKRFGCNASCIDLARYLAYLALKEAIEGRNGVTLAKEATEFGAPPTIVEAINFVGLAASGRYLDALRIAKGALDGLRWLHSQGVLKEAPLNVVESVTASAILQLINEGKDPSEALRYVESILPKDLVAKISFFVRAKEIERLVKSHRFGDVIKIVDDSASLARYALALIARIDPSKLGREELESYIETVKKLSSVGKAPGELLVLATAVSKLLRAGEKVFEDAIRSLVATVSREASSSIAKRVVELVKEGRFSEAESLIKRFPGLSSVTVNGIPLLKFVEEARKYRELLDVLSTLRNARITQGNALQIASLAEKALRLLSECKDIVKHVKGFDEIASELRKTAGIAYMIAALSALAKGSVYDADRYVEKAARFYIPSDLAIMYQIGRALASRSLTLNDILRVLSEILGPVTGGIPGGLAIARRGVVLA